MSPRRPARCLLRSAARPASRSSCAPSARTPSSTRRSPSSSSTRSRRLLRNAVAHGVEPAGERIARGKSAHATITIRARQDGNLLVLDVADDGRGVDTSVGAARALSSRPAGGALRAQLASDDLAGELVGDAARDASAEMSSSLSLRAHASVAAKRRSFRLLRIVIVACADFTVWRTVIHRQRAARRVTRCLADSAGSTCRCCAAVSCNLHMRMRVMALRCSSPIVQYIRRAADLRQFSAPTAPRWQPLAASRRRFTACRGYASVQQLRAMRAAARPPAINASSRRQIGAMPSHRRIWCLLAVAFPSISRRRPRSASAGR